MATSSAHLFDKCVRHGYEIIGRRFSPFGVLQLSQAVMCDKFFNETIMKPFSTTTMS